MCLPELHAVMMEIPSLPLAVAYLFHGGWAARNRRHGGKKKEFPVNACQTTETQRKTQTGGSDRQLKRSQISMLRCDAATSPAVMRSSSLISTVVTTRSNGLYIDARGRSRRRVSASVDDEAFHRRIRDRLLHLPCLQSWSGTVSMN